MIVCPNQCLVEKEDMWRKFWHTVFYESSLNALNENGVKYVIQAEKDWDNSLKEPQLNDLLEQTEKFCFQTDKLENFKLVLHRFLKNTKNYNIYFSIKNSYVNVSNPILERVCYIVNSIQFHKLKSIEICLSR